MRSLPWIRWIGVLCLVGLSGFLPDRAVAGERSFVLRARHLVPATPDGPLVIEDAVVVVREGKIVAVGRQGEVAVPAGLPVHDVRDGYVMPGLVAVDSDWAGSHRGDESVGAGYRAIDAFDTYADFRDTVAAGVTTVHLDPGQHRLLTGRGGVVKLTEARDEQVLRAESDLAINLGVYGPPEAVEFPFPASSDVSLKPPVAQRPLSRLGQLLGLREEISAALAPPSDERYSYHRDELGRAWQAGMTVRVRADRAADLLGGLSFLEAHDRQGYLVGGAESHRIVDSLRRSKRPLAYQPRYRFDGGGGDLGAGDLALDLDEEAIAALDGIELALCPPAGQAVERLRLTAALAHRSGLEAKRAILAVTSTPARLLGVADRVGSIAVGRDADLVVLTGHPLHVSSHVSRVIVSGRTVYETAASTNLVVRAGTIWVSPEKQIRHGEMLVEDGRVVSVGASVPHPPGARVIDAGPHGFVAPGFIDAKGHLGLDGDRSRVPLSTDLTLALGAPDERDDRVARAGVTSVLMTSYAFDGSGSRLAAIKTQGVERNVRVTREVVGIGFSVAGQDPDEIPTILERQLSRGRRYVQAWEKYEKELATFLEKEAKGESTERETVEEVVEGPKEDRITGVWEGTVEGGPLRQPVTGKMALRLSGSSVEGRVIEPSIPVEHRIVMELTGDSLQGEIEVDTDGMGHPQIQASITGPDAMEGSVSLMGVAVTFTAKRVEKRDVEFKVERRRRVAKGRPQPPEVDPGLEPYRDLFAKKIPLVVEARRPAVVKAVVEMIAIRNELPLVIVDGTQAYYHADLLAKGKVGVVVPTRVVSKRRAETIHVADRLDRASIAVAFQSEAEDGASQLPNRALFAVEQGLAADTALAALTWHPAHMFKLEDRIGSLEEGRDADFVICRGHPFRAGGRIERVFINGQEVRR